MCLVGRPSRNRAGPGIEKALEEMRRNGGGEIPDRIGQKGGLPPSLPTAKQEEGRGGNSISRAREHLQKDRRRNLHPSAMATE